MPNLGEQGRESTRNTLVSFEVYICFTLAFDMFRVQGVVDNRARDPIRKFRDAPSDKAVDVERDSSNGNCFVTAWKVSIKASTGKKTTPTCSYLA